LASRTNFVDPAFLILPYIGNMQHFRRTWYAVLVLMLCYRLSLVDQQIEPKQSNEAGA